MCVVKLFLLYRSNHHQHPLSFELRHLLGLSVLLEVDRKSQEKFFALLGEEDRTSAEEDICLDLVALLQETLRMVEFELVVVLICLRPEADLLDDDLGGIGLLFLGLFLPTVQEA